VEDTIARRINITGKPLAPASTARTVRVRGGDTLVSDGPFAATKEFIGGFDLLECEDMDEAIEVAAKHPVAWFDAIELRPLLAEADVPQAIDSKQLNQMMLVCIDGVVEAPEVEEQIGRDCETWREQIEASGVRVAGAPIAAASEARTVRVRDGETLITDGPFLDTKEYIGGIGILDCESLDQAIEVTARHPIARTNAIELRELAGCKDIPEHAYEIDPEQIGQMLLVCVDGIPEAPEVEARIAEEGVAWRDAVTAAGINVLNQPLTGPEEAKVIRVRDGETLITDGPFVETKEFLAGFDLLNCAELEDAVGWAARHPIAAFHMIEARQFIALEGV
jgi:hypothetical protein